MFWEDYLERVPASQKWIDRVEPALARHYGGSMYRAMANIRLPEWRTEITRAIDSALDAGIEGFWVDNLFWWHGESLFADFLAGIRAHAARRKSNLAWHVNVNTGILNWGRAGNVVGTEDGKARSLHLKRNLPSAAIWACSPSFPGCARDGVPPLWSTMATTSHPKLASS
jgi:hypothetical protein